MRTALLVLALAMLAASGAFAVSAATATMNLYPMSQQICAPLVPFDPYPFHFDNLGNPVGCFSGWMDLFIGADTIKKYDPTTGGEATLLAEWDGAAQGVLAGDGYIGWVDGYSAPSATPVKSFSFQGADISDTDLWISLPGITGGSGGDHWVGITYPTNKTIDYWSVVVTDGSSAWTMLDIVTGAGPQDWMNPQFIYFDPVAQGEKPVPWEFAPVLYGGQMYRVNTLKPNLALIIPHPL